MEANQCGLVFGGNLLYGLKIRRTAAAAYSALPDDFADGFLTPAEFVGYLRHRLNESKPSVLVLAGPVPNYSDNLLSRSGQNEIRLCQ